MTACIEAARCSTLQCLLIWTRQSCSNVKILWIIFPSPCPGDCSNPPPELGPTPPGAETSSSWSGVLWFLKQISFPPLEVGRVVLLSSSQVTITYLESNKIFEDDLCPLTAIIFLYWRFTTGELKVLYPNYSQIPDIKPAAQVAQDINQWRLGVRSKIIVRPLRVNQAEFNIA